MERRRSLCAALCVATAAFLRPAMGDSYSESVPPLQMAAGEADLEKVQKLLADGADVNAVSSMGETALHVSGIFCKPEVIKALLEAGAKVNVHTTAGEAMSMTPLHWFVNMNPCGADEVQLLLDAGADVTAVNSQGATPFDMVVKMPHRQDIAKLVHPPGTPWPESAAKGEL
eukprot:TRINITY_DN42738_c0_g1_i1.p1 TRINITY_DN42738_c0_g1~~TRINITY_DN42738_c0_g1_i1.p1  ORF type:complete len:172 (+),score=39.44 TRINITY_DN42738_c0_g1_i1:63-578(+)